MAMIKDLLGERFGKWTVIDYVGINAYNKPVWLCQCDCGTWRELTHNTLLYGDVVSCGCETKKKLNKYIVRRNGCKCILSNGTCCLFDYDDYVKVKPYHWLNSGGYVVAYDGNRKIQFHRLIMNCPEGMVVDHINHDKLDNRKCNLRVCTPLQNAWNTIHPRFTDGFRGVVKRKNDWVVKIMVDGQLIVIGYYDRFEDAVEARLKAEKFYYGEFAPERGFSNA